MISAFVCSPQKIFPNDSEEVEISS